MLNKCLGEKTCVVRMTEQADGEMTESYNIHSIVK
jgi:hypothetical protein